MGGGGRVTPHQTSLHTLAGWGGSELKGEGG